MQVLLVEDDENKRGQLISFFEENVPQARIEIAASYHTALWHIDKHPVDLIILDMTLPSFDINADESGGPSELYGGREILEQMDRLEIAIPTIVVTQFDRFGEQTDAMTLEELDQQLTNEFPNVYFGAVYYNAAREDWKGELQMRIRNVLVRREPK